jgi:hypothetical protein
VETAAIFFTTLGVLLEYIVAVKSFIFEGRHYVKVKILSIWYLALQLISNNLAYENLPTYNKILKVGGLLGLKID